MDLELGDDQVALRDGIRRYDLTQWSSLVDAGVLSLKADGFTTADACVVFEELGRALAPGPVAASYLAGEHATLLDLTEHPLLLEHPDAPLLAIDTDGVHRAEAVGVTDVESPFDPGTPLRRLERVELGERVAGAGAWRTEGAVVTAAYLVGTASACTERAVAYAKDRRQFDRPIGSFQAIKHICADMLMREELARAAVYAAGVTFDDPSVGDPAKATAVAKVVASEAAVKNAKACIQVHGGMGFTWDVDAHLYLRRARVLETHFGSVDHHCEAVAGAL